MSAPKSVIKFKKGNLVYTSNVDRVQYNLLELTRGAMKDVGKFLTRKMNEEAQKLPGLKRSKRVRGSTSAFRWQVPFAENGLPHLEVGITHKTWYGTQQELGDSNQPKRGIMRNTTEANIQTIVEIESKYLSALEEDVSAMIDEKEAEGSEEE